MQQRSAWPGLLLPEMPASTGEIFNAELALGRKFPPDLVEILLCSRRWLWRESKYDAVIFLAPTEIVDETRKPEAEMDEIKVAVTLSESSAKPYYYSQRRVTFAYSDYYRFQIDEDPGPAGEFGQVVEIDHDQETIAVIYDTFEAFVQHGIACLRAELQERLDEQGKR